MVYEMKSAQGYQMGGVKRLRLAENEMEERREKTRLCARHTKLFHAVETIQAVPSQRECCLPMYQLECTRHYTLSLTTIGVLSQQSNDTSIEDLRSSPIVSVKSFR